MTITSFPIPTTAVSIQTLIEQAADDAAVAAAAAAASSSATAQAYASQATLAAQSAGAPLYTSMPTISVAIPSPFMLQTSIGVQIYTHDNVTATFVGWLGEVLFDDEATLLAYNGDALPVDAILRTRKEGFSYRVVTSNEDETTAGADKLSRESQIVQLATVGRPVSPTPVASGTAGVLNGTYYWSVTYVTANGETEASIGVAASPANKQVNVGIPVSTDRRVTARKLYRTTVGGTESQMGYLVATINDNTTTTYTDNIADGSLGAAAPHIDTSGGVILDGTDVVFAVSGLAISAGKNAMPGGKGYACTAIGAYALAVNAGGYRNTAIGTDALRANTIGRNNVGIGVHALDENIDGNDSVAIGLNALFKSKDDQNTAIGSNAGADLASGTTNTFIGSNAGQLRTTGDGNTMIGSSAGYAAGSGSQNTGIGQNALLAQTTGNFGTAIGFDALRKATTGALNTAIGWGAGYNCVTGEANVFIGARAGYYETNSNRLWVDVYTRTDLADAKTKALIYGEFWVNRAGQKLDVNGQINPLAGLGMPGRTVTADGDVTVDDTVLTCNKAGTLTLTLTPCDYKYDKILILRNLTANTVVSASSNITPIAGGADSTAILPATAGAWAIIRQKNTGTAWEIIARGT